MIRRNLSVLAASVVAATLLITGCKKDTNEVNENADAFSVARAKQWYTNTIGNKQKNNVSDQSRKKIGKFSPLWDKAFSSNDDKYEVVETPLSFDRNPGFASSSDPSKSKVNGITRMLILKNKKTGDIQPALMHIFSGSGTEDKNITYSKGKQDFTGTIFFTDLDGNFVNGWQYEKGKIIRKGDKEVSSNNTSAKLPLPGEGECQILEISWYQRDCQEVTYNSNIYTCGPWQYMSSTYVTYCFPTGGGGDGGSYGGESLNNCNRQELQAQADGAIGAGFSVAENLVISGTGLQTINANGEITRDVNIQWDFHKGTFLNYSWKYVSYERGVHKQVAGIWKWKSLTHNTETIVGSYPFSIDLKMNTSTSSISTSEVLAGMALNFSTKITVSCFGLNFTRARTDNSSLQNIKATL